MGDKNRTQQVVFTLSGCTNLLKGTTSTVTGTVSLVHSGEQGQAANTGGDGNGFNINNAVSTLNENALSQSSSSCAKYVRWALEAGGINTNPHPRSAKDYGPYLQQWGFHSVSRTNYQPLMGDIGVIQPYQGGNPNGHIQMYNGNKWISDFRQRDMWPGPGYRTSQPNLTIYRW